MARGLFVTFEGGEGAGKSTQLLSVAERAREQGLEVVTCREPGGTPFGEQLRAALFALKGAPSPMAELLTFAAARAELVATAIRPALKVGALVLCDRFTDSTVAYQGYGRGIDLAKIEAVNAAATGGLTPDVTVLLDLPPAEGRARRAMSTDYLEREDGEFHTRVRDGFLALARQAPERITMFNAARDREELADAIWTRLQTALRARN